MRLISRGAEAELFLDKGILTKIRKEKKYRNPILDRTIRKSRLRREVKVLKKLKESNFPVPEVYEVYEEKSSFSMEYLEGKVLKELLDKEKLFSVFELIMKLHEEGIVHGDLTTLNMIYAQEKIFFIDFGLAQFSKKNEERAVDLLVFFQCLRNEHEKYYEYKEHLLKNYEEKLTFGKQVLKRFKKLEERGRNK